MAQRLRAVAALPEDNSVPSPHIEQLTIIYKPSFRGSDTFFWPLGAPAHTCVYTDIDIYSDRDTHTYVNKK